MIQFNHFNFNVLNLEKSLKLYKDTLNLDVYKRQVSSVTAPVSLTCTGTVSLLCAGSVAA